MNKERLISYLSLFTSAGTIVCCALPSLLVTLGLGGALASFIGVFPQIVWISEHKVGVFLISGTLILLSFGLLYLNRNAPCPIDPKLADVCKKSRKWSLRILIFAAVTWLIGFTFAYILPYLG